MKKSGFWKKLVVCAFVALGLQSVATASIETSSRCEQDVSDFGHGNGH